MESSQAIQHLKSKDPKLEKAIDKIGKIDFPEEKHENYFFMLTKSIVFQQLSGKAANTIFTRILNLMNSEFSPEALLSIPIEKLREAGLSERKASYVKDLALHFKENKINSSKFKETSDEKLIEILTDVKGIGTWTAEMFLMFSLGRKDVFSPKDLGLHKAVCQLYDKKFPLKEEELLKISEKWKPYRTLASLYLWKLKDE